MEQQLDSLYMKLNKQIKVFIVAVRAFSKFTYEEFKINENCKTFFESQAEKMKQEFDKCLDIEKQITQIQENMQREEERKKCEDQIKLHSVKSGKKARKGF